MEWFFFCCWIRNVAAAGDAMSSAATSLGTGDPQFIGIFGILANIPITWMTVLPKAL